MIQFDIENQIMTCWGIVEDIKCLRLIQDERAMSEDEQANFLLGLETIYQAKFEILQNMFEKFMKEYYQAKKSVPIL